MKYKHSGATGTLVSVVSIEDITVYYSTRVHRVLESYVLEYSGVPWYHKWYVLEYQWYRVYFNTTPGWYLVLECVHAS